MSNLLFFLLKVISRIFYLFLPLFPGGITQPILAICAGSWQLWQFYGDKIRPVRDHCYNGGMVGISDVNGDTTRNVQIHRVRIKPKSMLTHIFPPIFLVNSVHSKAPSHKSIPEIMMITALSQHDAKIAPYKRHSNTQMDVEENVIEAFETKYGAPTVGIQWHPEAYNKYEDTKGVVDSEKHREIISYMAQAGKAYFMKRKMLYEFNELIREIA